ncbi:polypeptide N-acetylgalactosaminyltransferase 15 [Bufo bufo]|uniref:polypeptide N-acetylgalactosaminyltransferase 15 n=1 Tax=Bufo bufo TaxID=8384 RepID=UPI001ABEB293|nr:polypeptide N-acetylgalactosaminyltransferase 15 [Bufo bufo]
MLRKRCRSLLCQLQILVLMLALVLLLVMVAMLDPEVQSEDNSIYLNQHGGGGPGWAGVGSLLEPVEETNKVEVLSPLSSLRDEELIAIGMSGSRRSFDKVRKNMYRIVKQHKRKNGNDVLTNIEQTEQAKNTHGFEAEGSQKVSLRRTIPEGRHSLCLKQIYNENLPTTSVIITFHNAAWSTLLRTVHSVLDNSPRKILKEIILVDDLSHQDHLKTALSEYVSRIGGVKLIRSNKRLGVIGGRMLGAARATGEILVFMDPHCECHPGWLEPLLSRIMNNRNCIVSPVLDVIDGRTFKYYHSTDLRQGVFDWNLDFHWVTLSESDQKVRQSPIVPFRTPVIPGCVIAVDRHYFQNIGAFDTFMNVSGVENIELSVRVWLCGGSVEIVPCSRVGHLLENKTYNAFQNETTLRNKIRIAEVWMDAYKENFYHNIGKEFVAKLKGMNDFTELKQLRLRLGCKGFTWFISDIDPAMNTTYSVLHSLGQLFNSGAGQCVQCSYNRGIQLVELSICDDKVNQVFVYYDKKIQLRATGSLCLDVTEEKVLLRNCTFNGVSTWDFNEDGLMIHLPTGKCMEPGNTQTGSTLLFIKPCNYRQKNQIWKIIPE